MNITYSFEITTVDVSARCMEVLYTAEGHETIRMGTRIPYEGEALTDVIRMYAPIQTWLEKQQTLSAPLAGTKGVVTHLAPDMLLRAVDEFDLSRA